MEATGPSIGLSRRYFARGLYGTALGLTVARAILADRSNDVLSVLDHIATALDAGNPTDALSQFDKSMPGYSQLEDYFVALTSQTSVHTDIDLLEESGSAAESTVVLRWILDLRDKVTNESVDRRIKEVHARLALVTGRHGGWRIVAFDPIDLFNPAVH
jgi:hypothetical protein